MIASEKIGLRDLNSRYLEMLDITLFFYITAAGSDQKNGAKFHYNMLKLANYRLNARIHG